MICGPRNKQIVIMYSLNHFYGSAEENLNFTTASLRNIRSVKT